MSPSGGSSDLEWLALPDPAAESSSTELSHPAVVTAPQKSGLSQGWGRLLRSNRIIWVIAAVAILSLAGGLLIGGFVISPGQAGLDAEAPNAGLITVPVELRELSNDVTIRADVGYADSVDVRVETGDLGGPAVVTGRVPEVGAALRVLSVALEAAGRPLIVLPGGLPAYRTLRIGDSGPDVVQLKRALSAVGISVGDTESNIFDSATSAALQQLYNTVGYAVPSSPEGTAESVRAAQDGVRSAELGVAAAQRAVNAAGAGPSAATRLQWDNSVASAKRTVTTAQAALAAAEALDPADPLKPATVLSAQNSLADATDTLALVELQRLEALAPGDSTDARGGLEAANSQLTQARAQLGEARRGTLTFLPAGEVLYLADLPRRVDEVLAARGTILQGVAMKVSGAETQLVGSAAEADAKLLRVGDAATFDLPDGAAQTATVTAVAPATTGGSTSTSGAGRWTVVLIPGALTPQQTELLRGQNVRVSVPVGSTEGAVLAVPLAALTAGPGGESRVEVVESGTTGRDPVTRLVVVKTGLAAGGYVEVTAIDGALDEGALVVVGR
ncbi:MAG: hypothetical protein LH471_03640 [Salinibacterium sp.]|nr:hypothetical protein [Salinibacterium sp.]